MPKTCGSLVAAAARIECHAPALPSPTSTTARPDFAKLYPALRAPDARPSFLVRSARAVAFRLSVLGTAAALLTILHH